MPKPFAFDVEATGRPSCADLVKAARNLTDPVKIAADLKARIDKMGLRPDFADLACVGIQFQGSEPLAGICRDDDDRRARLEWFWDCWRTHPVRIGFNSLHYDLPVLIRQSQLLSVDYPRDIEIGRYRADSIDLMQHLTFRGEIDPLGLVAYCRLFGRPNETSDDGDGSMVAAWVAAGEYDKVSAHCAEDLARTLWLAERIGVVSAVRAEPEFAFEESAR